MCQKIPLRSPRNKIQAREVEIWRKNEILWVGVSECKKTSDFENWNFKPFITVFFYISRVSDSRIDRETTHKMCKCIRQIFVSQVWVATHSQGTRETLYLKFLGNWNSLKISWCGTTHKRSHKMAKHSFSTQRFWHFDKNFQHKSEKNHFHKQIKYSKKKKIWLDHQATEHTYITFEHVQSHKWNKYSLNIRLVWVSSMN